MSWRLPDSAIEQMRGHRGGDNAGGNTAEFAFKGPYADLETARKNLAVGDVIVTGWSAVKWNLTPISAGWGELSIECVPTEQTEPDPDDPETDIAKPLEDLWFLRSCRNDVSIMAYCGPSPGANPQRADIEMWMKETDKELYDEDKFKDGKGVEQELSDPSKALAAKIRKGVQSVIRFYPLLTRKRVYARQPPKCMEKLGYIDIPPSPGTDAKKPGGVDAAISAHQWLKCQDDAQQMSDEKWERTEAWMGIAKTDDEHASPWDEDLYGANRWSMPAQI